jgi:bis(5'-nucleosidyl)-tetraphosphatase
MKEKELFECILCILTTTDRRPKKESAEPQGALSLNSIPSECMKIEETGIGDWQFRWGQGFKETEPYNRGRQVARDYLAATSQREVVFSINPAIGVPEHHEYRWLTYSQLEKLAPARLRPVIRWARSVVEG